MTQGGKNHPALDTSRGPGVLTLLGIQALFSNRKRSSEEDGLRRGERALRCGPGPFGMEREREDQAAGRWERRLRASPPQYACAKALPENCVAHRACRAGHPSGHTSRWFRVSVGEHLCLREP